MKKKAILIVAVLLVAFLVIVPAVSGATYEKGVINVSSNVYNAKVTVVGNNGDIHTGYTNTAGIWVSDYITSTTNYTVTVSKDGYTPESQYVLGSRLNGGSTEYLSFTLSQVSNGYLYVESSPSGYVYIDGDSYGQSPVSATLSAGSYNVTVKKSGYDTYSTRVLVTAGATTRVYPTLSSSTTYGYISVNSTPNYANVYVDGVFKGQTPITVTVPTGSHKLEVSKSGYTGFSTDTYVYEGRTNTFMATLSQNVTYAYILIGSNPSGATVYLDGSEIGTTPNSGSLSHTVTANTTHSLTIKASGYDTYSTSFNLVTNETKSFYPTLTKSQPQAGYVNISSVPSGASVYIDTVYAGSTPLYQAVDAGTHNIKLSCLGYNDYTTTVTVIAGQTAPVQATMTATSTPSTKSPVPVLGILIGLGAAAIFAGRKLRR